MLNKIKCWLGFHKMENGQCIYCKITSADIFEDSIW